MRKFYYAVNRGRQPGIYNTWDQCEQQVLGFPNPRYRKFPTLSETQHFCNLPETEPRLGLPKLSKKHAEEYQSTKTKEEGLDNDQDNLETDSQHRVNLDESVVPQENGTLKESPDDADKQEFIKVIDIPSATYFLQRQVDQSDRLK